MVLYATQVNALRTPANGDSDAPTRSCIHIPIHAISVLVLTANHSYVMVGEWYGSMAIPELTEEESCSHTLSEPYVRLPSG
jgi:hypothetical protein